MPLATIHLYDELAQEFTSSLVADITSTRDAVDALQANYPTFRQTIIRQASEGYAYKIVVGDSWQLGEEDLEKPIGRQSIHFYPVIAGSGNIGKIVLGVALLGVGLLATGPILGVSATTIALVGGSLALQGILGLFANPTTEDPNTEDETKPSLVMSGVVNTVASGGRIPIAYGRGLICGSQVISAAVRSTYIEFDDDDD